MQYVKKIMAFCLSLCLAAALASCGKSGTAQQAKNFKDTDEVTNYVKITMEDGKAIIIELEPKVAPITVKNFQDLVKKGFYNGLTFHRIVPGFVIQGGDPYGDGTGGPGYYIKGEFAKNGVKNDIKHVKGVVSMARSQAYDSAGSQFFICLEAAPNLDGSYAAFGKVVKGMDVVEGIVANYQNGKDPVPKMKKVSFVKPE